MTSPSPITVEPFFALRTPLLPLRELLAWGQGLRCATVEDPEAFAKAYAEDRALLRSRLKEWVVRPEIREALFVASPDLVDSLARWESDPESEKGQRTEQALVRYLGRLCQRCTPFGLFAGHALGHMGEATSLELRGIQHWKRSSRLDMDYLCSLAELLQQEPALRATRLLRPNNTLYRSAGRLRYVEARRQEGRRTFHLVALEVDEPLLRVLDRSRDGARLDEVAAALVEEEVSLDEARAFVHQLLDHQVLVADLEPPTTGSEPLPGLLEALREVALVLPADEAAIPAEVCARLAEAAERLEALDRGGLGNGTDGYAALVEGLEALPAPVERSKLWQVDLFPTLESARLGPAFRRELLRALEVLRRITPPSLNDPFRDFKEGFERRFEGRFVPLLEALDQECGVGFSGSLGNTVQGAPLLEGLPLRPGAPTSGARSSGERAGALGRRERHLLRRLDQLNAGSGHVLELNETDLQALEEHHPRPLPSSLSVSVEPAAASPEAFARGEFQLLVGSAGGPGGARRLGRFCYGDPELLAEVRAHLRREEACRPAAVFAEIAHLPHGRTGNVLSRPCLRDFELPFLGRSGADSEAWLPLSDLRVGLVEERVVLWSVRLDREVLPRLTSALDYEFNTTDLFRFLGCLQDQGLQTWIGWTWGELSEEPHLPRVCHGPFVFAREQWRLEEEALQSLRAAQDAAARFQALRALAQERGLPRHLVLGDGDNELPLDLDNPLSVEAFWGAARRQDALTLLEDFPGPLGAVVAGAQEMEPKGMELEGVGPSRAGAHCVELLVPLLCAPEAPEPPLPKPDLKTLPLRHTPGSEWLYAKLYCGQSTADTLLLTLVAPLLEDALAEGLADRWFFVRYSDPEPHLRVRVHGDPEALWGHLLLELQARVVPLLEEGFLWRFALDTFEPETGRYGGAEALPILEQLFQADSEAVLEILRAYPGDLGAEARWKLGLRGLDASYDDAGLDLEARTRHAAHMRESYAREFGAGEGPVAHALGERYRKNRRAITEILDPAQDLASPLLEGLQALHRRSHKARPLFAQLRHLEAQGRLHQPLDKLLSSLNHMALNRLLRSAQREQEGVLYDFVDRHYQSAQARRRKG